MLLILSRFLAGQLLQGWDLLLDCRDLLLGQRLLRDYGLGMKLRP